MGDIFLLGDFFLDDSLGFNLSDNSLKNKCIKTNFKDKVVSRIKKSPGRNYFSKSDLECVMFIKQFDNPKNNKGIQPYGYGVYGHKDDPVPSRLSKYYNPENWSGFMLKQGKVTPIREAISRYVTHQGINTPVIIANSYGLVKKEVRRSLEVMVVRGLYDKVLQGEKRYKYTDVIIV